MLTSRVRVEPALKDIRCAYGEDIVQKVVGHAIEQLSDFAANDKEAQSDPKFVENNAWDFAEKSLKYHGVDVYELYDDDDEYVDAYNDLFLVYLEELIIDNFKK